MGGYAYYGYAYVWEVLKPMAWMLKYSALAYDRWEALKPMAWMLKYSALASYDSLEELVQAHKDHHVLDKFIFEKAEQAGMKTGGLEDGSYMCLLFDTIESKAEASAYIGNFLGALKDGMVMQVSDDNAEEIIVENVTKKNPLTQWYTCTPLCDFASAWNNGVRAGFKQLGRNEQERKLLQRVQRRHVSALSMYRNHHMATTVERLVNQRPKSRHCFVLGLAHLLDHGATCSGNDVVQLLNARGRSVRHIPVSENICKLILKPGSDLHGMHLGALRVAAEKAGVSDTIMDAVLNTGKSDDAQRAALIALLQKKAAEDWSKLMAFDTKPWLNSSTVAQNLVDVCDFNESNASEPGGACTARSFQCAWNHSLSLKEENDAIREMRLKWNDSNIPEPEPRPEPEPAPEPDMDKGLYFEALYVRALFCLAA